MMKQREQATLSYQLASPHTVSIPHELIPLLPANWPAEIPLARITTCGPTVSIAVLRQIHPGTETDGHPTLVYGPPDDALLEEKGASTALLLLAVLASQPHFSATKDWLSETLGHGTHDDDEDDLDGSPGLKRVDNVATQLRHLLFPPVLRDLPTTNQLRRRLVISYRASRESGSGYRLAGLPLLWIDVEAIGEHLKQARALEQFGHDGLPAWQATYEVAGRGIFLEREPYSDWASWRRQQVETQLLQSVQALWRPLANQGEAGETEAVRILQSYWQNHMTNEDVLRPLIELLGKRECYGQAEEYYAHLCLALEQEDRQPDHRTQETMTFLRALQIQREPAQYQSILDEKDLLVDSVSQIPSQKTGAALALSPKSSHLTQSLLDLDLLDSYADALHMLLMKGETLYVMYASQNWYQNLKQLFVSSKDVRSAHILFRFGMLVGSTQECILPWYQRSYEVIKTYNDIENNVISKYDLYNQFSQEYIQLIAKRGRQYRVLWKFEESLKACEDGINRLIGLNDSSLLTHFLCEYSHIEATKGEEISWMYKLEDARKYALDMGFEDREKALNQINYIQGEGYKRFAFHTQKNLTLSVREKFAKRAIEQFHEWRGTTIELPGFESLVVQVSKVQCLILLNPDEAIHEARRLEKQVGHLYPTLLDKLRRVNFLAQQRLQMRDDEFLQAFHEKPLTAYDEGGNIL